MQSQLEEKDKEGKALRQKLGHLEAQGGQENIRKVNGIPVLAQRLEGLTNEELRGLADSLKQKIGSGVVVLGAAADDKAFLVVSVTQDLVERIRADQLIREIAPLIGGGGGGRADFAQAGGKKVEFLDQALEKSYSIIEKMT
jgi:alanyl-tRNA synthetase